MSVYVIREHSRLPDELHPEVRKDQQQSKRLFDWEEHPYDGGSPSYRANFHIGAEWFDENNALVVLPKKGLENLDWATMLMRCFDAEAGSEDGLGEIYKIDFSQPRIKTDAHRGLLTPLLVAHFLNSVRKVIDKGLKQGPIVLEENLRKVRGRIIFVKNLRHNLLVGRDDRVYCRFVEHSTNIFENRLLKTALIFCERICKRMVLHGSHGAYEFVNCLNKCMAAFSDVDGNVDRRALLTTKRSKLFREYDEATRLAKMILRRFEYNIDEASKEESDVPPFEIDMSLLYEHYVLALLRKAYGGKIKYQARVRTGYPDFLYADDSCPQILDTKYKPRYENGSMCLDDIRQLAGYARDRTVLTKLNVPKERQSTSVIPCVVIYPGEEGDVYVSDADINPALPPSKQMSARDVNGIVEYYLLKIDLPIIQHNNGK